MRGVRQAVNRVRRAGYTLDVQRQRDIPPEELEEARATAESLRGEDVERGFSMALGRLGDPADPDLVVARARDGNGRLVAVLTFVPWGADGLSLDLMRRARESENGTVEFVVAGVAEAARRLGVRRISLNFAVFRSVFERGARVGAGPVLRLWHRLLLVASRWWQIESLYRANAKYQPEWVPRFVCFRRAAELPRVAIAALEAEAFVQFGRGCAGWPAERLGRARRARGWRRRRSRPARAGGAARPRRGRRPRRRRRRSHRPAGGRHERHGRLGRRRAAGRGTSSAGRCSRAAVPGRSPPAGRGDDRDRGRRAAGRRRRAAPRARPARHRPGRRGPGRDPCPRAALRTTPRGWRGTSGGWAGECRAGEVVLPAGSLLTPAAVGLARGGRPRPRRGPARRRGRPRPG